MELTADTTRTPGRTSVHTAGQTTGGTLPRRLGALALAAAGLAFAAYPMLRGYGSEAGLTGAALYARPQWLLAHLLGMAGFVLAAFGLTRVDALAARAAGLGAVLVLPYYGAEAFGLHALGQRALATGDGDMIAAADIFRYQPVAMTIFALGLLSVAVAGARLLRLAGRGYDGRRVGLALTGLALLTYLPQFFVDPAGRIAHGLVLGLGLLALAVEVARAVPLGRRTREDAALVRE